MTDEFGGFGYVRSATGSDQSASTAAGIKAQLRRDQIRVARLKAQESALRADLAHPYSRFATEHYRNNILKRERAIERLLHSMNAVIHTDQTALNAALYQAQQIKEKGGITVTVELSLDGSSYSNPAPAVAHSAHVWVRAIIVQTITKPKNSGVAITHSIAHTQWTVPRGWTALDTIGRAGRDEYLVSNPLTVIREFTAPGSGATNKPFFVYVDVYEPVNS